MNHPTDLPVDYPIRQKSANGQPPVAHPAFRGCRRCGASFAMNAPGATGERGIWNDMAWWCSQECYDAPAQPGGDYGGAR
jgi:hypothetical protein